MRVYCDRGADTNLIKDPASARQFVIGAICAIAAVAIWAGWLVMMRLGVTTTLTAFDLTALRYAVAGIVLLPVVLRRGFAFNRLGWLGLTAVIIGVGAPVPLLIGAGLSFAPVAHASVLTYGIAPLIVACVAGVVLKERLVPIRKSGLVLVGLGALVIGGLGMLSFDGRQSIGHLLFLTADCLWAGYAVVMRRARLDGLHAAAIAAVVSLFGRLGLSRHLASCPSRRRPSDGQPANVRHQPLRPCCGAPIRLWPGCPDNIPLALGIPYVSLVQGDLV